MRFLKNKIALANAIKNQYNNQDSGLSCSEIDQNATKSSQPLTYQNCSPESKRATGLCSTPDSPRATKNLVKNYGRAICQFIASDYALPYLHKLTHQEGVKLTPFIRFVKRAKNSINGLSHFRSLLLVNQNDDRKTVAYRRIFGEMSEVFIKYFSVNWIYNSKILHKYAHLSFRFKMLRRIKNPELFTYLKRCEEANIYPLEKMLLMCRSLLSIYKINNRYKKGKN